MSLATEIEALDAAQEACNAALITKLNDIGTMANRDLFTGTTDPDPGVGVDGDIYIKTSA